MKSGSTLFFKAVVVAIGLVVLALYAVGLPYAITSDHVGYYRPIFFGMYIPGIPFYFALYQAMKLLRYIDQSKAFSQISIQALKNIKYCAIIISALYAAGLPYIYYVANKADAPGVIVIGLVIVFAAVLVATLAAVLQRLLTDALDIKSENDLTV